MVCGNMYPKLWYNCRVDENDVTDNKKKIQIETKQTHSRDISAFSALMAPNYYQYQAARE